MIQTITNVFKKKSDTKCQNCNKRCPRDADSIEALWRADTFHYIKKCDAYKKEIEFLQRKLAMYSDKSNEYN
jgi:heterodisulfide reductase subunit C